MSISSVSLSFLYRNEEKNVKPQSNVSQQSAPQPVLDDWSIQELSKDAIKHFISVSVETEPVAKINSDNRRIGHIDVTVRIVNISDHFHFDLGFFARNAW